MLPLFCLEDSNMAYFALFYDVVDDFVNRRTPYRDVHLHLANEARARGELVLAGALSDPAGALIVFDCEDIATPESFARNDPYVTNGLVQRWKVRPWAVVVGNQEPRAKSAERA
jgi:uncharacterized protein YciI